MNTFKMVNKMINLRSIGLLLPMLVATTKKQGGFGSDNIFGFKSMEKYIKLQKDTRLIFFIFIPHV
jgi:hypothetical protein